MDSSDVRSANGGLEMRAEQCNVVVTGGDTGLGAALAEGLAPLVGGVAVLGSTKGAARVSQRCAASGCRSFGAEVSFDSLSEITTALALAAEAIGSLEVVVHALTSPLPDEQKYLDLVDDLQWDASCERPLRAGLLVCHASHPHLKMAGGRLFFVTPTVGISGAAGLVPYTAAVEGLRALAKSAARKWGTDGILVNCIAPPVELVLTGVETDQTGLSGRSIRDPISAADVVAVIAALIPLTLTGTTTIVDGGTIMAP